MPPLVLYILQPQKVEHVEVHINGTLPLDVFFLLDASRSVSAASWDLALQFASDMGRALQEHLPHFRAGMGQFADRYEVIYPLSEGLSAWAAHADVVRETGHTRAALGFCGNDVELPVKSCEGGAHGELARADLTLNTSGLDCGITEAIRKIILVTDGVPADPELTVAAARHVKTANTSIMGILVEGSDPDRQANQAELYALTSCCSSGHMEALPGRWGQDRPKCTQEMVADCPNLVTRTDYEALVASVETLVGSLRQEMDCTGKVYTTRSSTDFGVLWFLLLLAPAMVFLCWQNILQCLSRSQRLAYEVRASLPFRRPEVELSSRVSSASEELEAATAAAEAVASALPTGGPPPALPEEGDAGVEVGGEVSRSSTAGRPSGLGDERTRASDGGFGGRKWAPVRTAYIVNGQRVNVDYGHRGSLPPMAQLGAHRGMDSWSEDQDAVRRQGSRESITRRVSRRLTRGLTRQLTRTFDVHVAGVPEEDVAPHLQRYNYSVLIPLTCTVLLIPLVVWKSGILKILGITR